MRYKLYASYGVLAHEKTPIFSDEAPASEAYNTITVEIHGQGSTPYNSGLLTLVNIV